MFMRLSVIVFLSIIVLSSCASKNSIIYLNSEDKNKFDVDYLEYRLNVDDVLKIDIETLDPQPIELPTSYNTPTKEVMIYNGFQVDLNGYIDYPKIGKIMVLNKTIDELKTLIQNSLIELKLYTNPSVAIKLLNSHVTILGEVNNPGRKEYYQNNINILEAISMAGDLTINGKRNDIKLIRQDRNQNIIAKIDLTDSKLLESPFFQLYSGDIIIVNPNSSRIKNAGIIGNSGTLLSLLSFVLSSIIVISN